jgi:hypothetical protein
MSVWDGQRVVCGEREAGSGPVLAGGVYDDAVCVPGLAGVGTGFRWQPQPVTMLAHQGRGAAASVW